MKYVDGYVIPIKKNKVNAYLKMARMGERVWKKHGALDYKECVGDDMKPPFGAPFPKSIRTKPGETVIFSYVVFKSRAHRDQVNARVMKQMEEAGGEPTDMPFNVKRMVYGGFKALVG